MSIREKAGRPEKPIDWKRVDELLEAGCPGTEIAPHFDIHPDSLYRQCQNKFGIVFTEYAAEKKQKGDSNIREKQYRKALKGDNTCLIWLGKNRLGQRETSEEQKFTPEIAAKFLETMQQMTAFQSSALKIADNNINNEQKS